MKVVFSQWRDDVLCHLRYVLATAKAIERLAPSDREPHYYLMGSEIKYLNDLAYNPPDSLQPDAMSALSLLRLLCEKLPIERGAIAGRFGFDPQRLFHFCTCLVFTDGLDCVREIIDLIAEAGPPERPQASVSDPGSGTANLSPPPGEITPEADSVPVRVINAAYALKKQGKRVSIRAACEKAGVDRKHLAKAYPDAVKTINVMAAPDRQPVRGSKENGNLEAWEEEDD